MASLPSLSYLNTVLANWQTSPRPFSDPKVVSSCVEEGPPHFSGDFGCVFYRGKGDFRLNMKSVAMDGKAWVTVLS